MNHRNATDLVRSARRYSFTCAAAVALLASGCAAPTPRERTLTDDERALNAKSFDVVWETVRDRHWDPNLGGIDWTLVRDELRPKVEQATTMSGAREHMSAALDRLQQSHHGIVPSEVYEAVDHGGPRGDGDAGFSIRVIDGRALVMSVRDDTPAARAGVKPGWELTAIEAAPIASTIDRITREYGNASTLQLMLVSAIASRLSGPAGEPLNLAFVDGDGRTRTLAIERAVPRGEPTSFGNIPSQRIWFESRGIDRDIGYIAFNMFFDPDRISRAFETAVRDFMSTRGIVLDLRGNKGGIGPMAMGIAGWFVERSDRPLGEMHTRDTRIRFAIFPRPEQYTGKLAILVDGCTASTSEILASGLRDLKRARLFGERTAGAALPSMFVRLPNGDGLQFAYADYFSAAGDRLESIGVLPDEVVTPSREALLAGRDPVLQAAIEWIRSDATDTE